MSPVVKSDGSLHVKARASAYAVVLGLLGLPGTFAVVAALREPRFWIVVAISVAAIILAVLWLRAFELHVSDGGLRYSSLLGGDSSLPFSEIERIELEIGRWEYRHKFQPTVRLVVHPKPMTGRRPIVINLKVFGREEVAELHEVVSARLAREPGAPKR